MSNDTPDGYIYTIHEQLSVGGQKNIGHAATLEIAQHFVEQHAQQRFAKAKAGDYKESVTGHLVGEWVVLNHVLQDMWQYTFTDSDAINQRGEWCMQHPFPGYTVYKMPLVKAE